MNYQHRGKVTVEEARKLLGDEAKNMTDDEIQKLLEEMDILAQYALQKAREDQRREDAIALANLIYNIYKRNEINDCKPM